MVRIELDNSVLIKQLYVNTHDLYIVNCMNLNAQHKVKC